MTDTRNWSNFCAKHKKSNFVLIIKKIISEQRTQFFRGFLDKNWTDFGSLSYL